MAQTATALDIRRDLVAVLPKLRRFALMLTGDAATADELVQSVCHKAIAKSRLWKGEGRLEAWVYAMLRQQWGDDGRKRKTRTTSASPDADDGGSDKKNTILQLIASMPEASAPVFLLVHVEGYTYKQAGEILSIPMTAIAPRLAAARVHLAKAGDEISAKGF